MLKHLVDLARQVIALAGDVRKLKSEMKDRQQQDKQQDERIDELASVVRQLALALQHDRDIAVRDRENLILRLEVALFRLERGLPRGESSPPG